MQRNENDFILDSSSDYIAPLCFITGRVVQRRAGEAVTRDPPLPVGRNPDRFRLGRFAGSDLWHDFDWRVRTN